MCEQEREQGGGESGNESTGNNKTGRAGRLKGNVVGKK